MFPYPVQHSSVTAHSCLSYGSEGAELVLSRTDWPDKVVFKVSFDGSERPWRLLTPEHGIPLEPAPLPACHFPGAFRTLVARERQAVDAWTAPQMPSCAPSPSMPGHLPPQGACFSPYDLSSALDKLPARPGEYLATDEYPTAEAMPWGRSIRVGDIVTGYPRFLSAYSTDRQARWIVNEYAAQVRPYAVAFCKIRTSSIGTPVHPPAVCQGREEYLVLYPQRACFLVKGIAVAETRAAIFPVVRIGVLLEEFPGAALPKDLHTGASGLFRPWSADTRGDIPADGTGRPPGPVPH